MPNVFIFELCILLLFKVQAFFPLPPYAYFHQSNFILTLVLFDPIRVDKTVTIPKQIGPWNGFNCKETCKLREQMENCFPKAVLYFDF